MEHTVLAIACLFLQMPAGWSAEPLPPIENYRRLAFPPNSENCERGWKDRVAADYVVINSADLTSLRAALHDGDPFVRAIARTLLQTQLRLLVHATASAVEGGEIDRNAILAGNDNRHRNRSTIRQPRLGKGFDQLRQAVQPVPCECTSAATPV